MVLLKKQAAPKLGAKGDLLFEAFPAGLCLIGGDGRVNAANPEACALFGLSFDLLFAQPVEDRLHAEDALLFLGALASLAEGQLTRSELDVRLVPAKGMPFWVAVFLCPAPGGMGKSYLMQFQSIDRLMNRVGKLQKNEMRWKYALESAYQGVWDHDYSSNDLYYSPTWKRLRGLATDTKVDGSLDSWIKTVHPDDRLHVLESIRLQEEVATGFSTFQYRERHADGRWVWIESRGAPVEWNKEGKVTRIIGTDTDVTERKMAEMQLEQFSRRLKLALDISKIGVFETNLDTGTLSYDAQLLLIYGMADKRFEQVGYTFEDLIHPDDSDQTLDAVRRGIASQEVFSNEFRIIRPDGSIRHIRSSSMTFVDAEGAHKMISGNWDVTPDIALQDELLHANRLAEGRNRDLEAARIRMEHNALHDHLTGLPNRRWLDRKFENIAAGETSICAILHIDLDRFKQINDTLGHEAGDVILVHTATVLREIGEERDFVARIGGDEFVLLCGEYREKEELAALAQRIVEALRQPVQYNGHPCRCAASIGIASMVWFGVDPKQALMNADIALYRAKGLGRNGYEFFTQELQTQILHNKRTADEIMSGLEQGEFIPFYQPQFDARTLAVSGVETLARWAHPVHGILGPDYFLKIAEDINVVSLIDRCIAEQALQDFSRWETAGVAIPRVSVNVSSRRLREPDLITSLNQLEIPEGKLSFELLESIFLDDLEHDVSETLGNLRALGIDIEVDDFGTGHASIVGLLQLRPKRLKIDRALVKPITETQEQRRLVGSIIDIGHSLNIEVVAEGVETLDHADMLRDMGCDTLQGYGLGRPMPRIDLEHFMKSSKARKAD